MLFRDQLFKLANIRLQRYQDHGRRLEFASFMDNLAKIRFPISEKKKNMLTMDERRNFFPLKKSHQWYNLVQFIYLLKNLD
jgi:hypothetical protein